MAVSDGPCAHAAKRDPRLENRSGGGGDIGPCSSCPPQDLYPTLVHVLELRRENLETVEVQIASSSPCVGRQTSTDKAEVAVGSTELRAGDQLLAVLEPGKEEELRRALLPPE